MLVYFMIFVAFILFLTLMITSSILLILDLNYHSNIFTNFHLLYHPIITKCLCIFAFIYVLTISKNISKKPCFILSKNSINQKYYPMSVSLSTISHKLKGYIYDIIAIFLIIVLSDVALGGWMDLL